MATSSLFLLFTLFLFPVLSHSMDTLVLDGLTQWKSPIIQVGDSLVFKHKKLQNLYLFKNQKDFHLCNLSQATLVSSSTHFMWRGTRPGYYYYSTGGCEDGEKVAVRVVPAPPHPSIAFPPVTAPPLSSDPGVSTWAASANLDLAHSDPDLAPTDPDLAHGWRVCSLGPRGSASFGAHLGAWRIRLVGQEGLDQIWQEQGGRRPIGGGFWGSGLWGQNRADGTQVEGFAGFDGV